MSPASASSLHGYSRQFPRPRRPRNANPYDAAAHSTRQIIQHTPPQAAASASQPTLDEGDDEEDTQETGDGDVNGDDEEAADIADITEEIDDGNGEGEGEGEGAIEEAADIDHESAARTFILSEDEDHHFYQENEMASIYSTYAYIPSHLVPMDIDPPFDATGLKEIGNLASWTVSTYKPGCGVEALRDEDTNMFWQSDGPQPHHLNIHFSRLVCILSIRIYLDFEADESYTPTRITLLAGTGYHDLLPFSSLEFSQPKGWIDVPLEGVGGGPDGNTLRAFLVQVKVVENHQNGKDTHVRGLKIYARDEKSGGGMAAMKDLVRGDVGRKPEKSRGLVSKETMLTEPDWMGEPELR